MSNKHGSKWIRPEKRLAIYARDGFACVYCKCPADEHEMPLTLDHVTPRELGGSNKANNLVTACWTCNSTKQEYNARRFFAMLRDRGVDTRNLSKRIARQLAKAINVKLGKQLPRWQHLRLLTEGRET